MSRVTARAPGTENSISAALNAKQVIQGPKERYVLFVIFTCGMLKCPRYEIQNVDFY